MEYIVTARVTLWNLFLFKVARVALRISDEAWLWVIKRMEGKVHIRPAAEELSPWRN